MKPTYFDGHDVNDGINYESHFPQGAARSTARFSPRLVERLVGAPQYVRQAWESNPLSIIIFIIGSDTQALLDQLKEWFDPSRGERMLRAQLNDGTNVYLNASVESLRIESRLQKPLQVTVRLLASDPRWLAYTETQTNWSVTGTGDTQAVTNAGNTYAYPTIEITPTSTKGQVNSWIYRRYVILANKSNKRWARWPWDITGGGLDTATLITAGKMKSDGSDIRVLIDGQEADYWLGSGSYAINTATTTIWVNLDLAPKVEVELAEDLTAGSPADGGQVQVKSTVGLPQSGFVVMDDECIQYKDLDAKHLRDIVRGARNTTAAAHTSGTSMYYVEHDIRILYGYSGAPAMDVDGDYEPMIDRSASLGGSSAQIRWTEFREEDKPRTASWKTKNVGGATDSTPCVARTGSYNSDADPAIKMGLQRLAPFAGHPLRDTWYLVSPVGVEGTGAIAYDWYTDYVSLTWWVKEVDEDGWLTTVQTKTTPTSPPSGSESVGVSVAAYELRFTADLSTISGDDGFALDNLVLKFGSSAPYLVVQGEESLYLLDCTITNNTTGESITIFWPMQLNETLILDCEAMTAEHDDSDVDCPQAVTSDAVRNYWLRLQPGSNTLQYDETGVAGVTVVIRHRGIWL